MSKLLFASIGLILVVFVSANTEMERQKTDLSLQNDLLTREAREAGRKDRKGKNRKVKKKTRKSRKNKGSKGKSRNKNLEKKKTKRRLKNRTRKNKGSRRRNGKKETIRKRNKNKKRKGGNKQTKRRGGMGKPIRRKGRNQNATTTGPPPTKEMCIKDMQRAMNIWRTAANNFKNKQAKRIERQLKVMKNKFDKSGVFSSIRASVIIVGGGDSKALECQGSKTSTVAKSMTTLAENLDKCNTNIQTDCNPKGLVDQTDLEKCNMTVTKFEEEADKCNDEKDVGKACMCWDMLVNGKQHYPYQLLTKLILGNSRETTKNVSQCSSTFQPVAKNIAAKNTKCKTTFMKCRGYEDSAAAKISACLQSASALSAKAKTLSENKDAVSKASAKINSLAGTGTNGTNSTRRSRRSISNCTDFIAAVNTCE